MNTQNGNANKASVLAIIIIVLSLVAIIFLSNNNGTSTQQVIEIKKENKENTTNKQVVTNKQVNNSENVKLSIHTDKSQYNVGEVIKADIVLESDINVSGADVYVQYDPEVFDLFKKEDSSVKLEKGEIFPNVFVVEQKNNPSEGVFAFSALSAPQNEFKGSGVLATLYFIAKKKGEGEISFVFEKENNYDTNVAAGGADKLNFVKGVNIIIN